MNSTIHTIADGAAGASGARAGLLTDLEPGRQRLGHKQLMTLQAQYALKGWCLFELADQGFVAGRSDCCRPLPDLYAATRFLHQIGGA